MGWWDLVDVNPVPAKEANAALQWNQPVNHTATTHTHVRRDIVVESSSTTHARRRKREEEEGQVLDENKKSVLLRCFVVRYVPCLECWTETTVLRGGRGDCCTIRPRYRGSVAGVATSISPLPFSQPISPIEEQGFCIDGSHGRIMGWVGV
jgi:hypothetical protein